MHQQVAELQQKIDYMIGQLDMLTAEGALTRPSVSKRVNDVPATGTQKEIGLNRFRAMQLNA